MSTCDGGVKLTQPLNQMADDGANPISSLQWHIVPIDHTTAKAWIEQWHYSHVIPKGKNIRFGLYNYGELYAVIVYGNGVNPYQARFLGVERVIELKRMCRSEPKRAFPLSRFIALTAKMAYKVYPYQCIVAFADPEQGHEGTVYKASNFKLHGTTNAEWHVKDESGVLRHRRYAYRYAKRNNVSIEEARNILKLTRVQTKRKFRWVKYNN